MRNGRTASCHIACVSIEYQTIPTSVAARSPALMPAAQTLALGAACAAPNPAASPHAAPRMTARQIHAAGSLLSPPFGTRTRSADLGQRDAAPERGRSLSGLHHL